MTTFSFIFLWVYDGFFSSSIFSTSRSLKRLAFTNIIVLSSPIPIFVMIIWWHKYLFLNSKIMMITNGQLLELVVASLEFAKLLFMFYNWAIIELSSICKSLFPKQNLSNVRHKLLAKVSKLAKLLVVSWNSIIVDSSWLWGSSSHYLMSTMKIHSVTMK